MLLGAHLAGLAIESSMLGATHACANPLSARYGTAHGVAIAPHAAPRGALERARRRARATRELLPRAGPRAGARPRAARSPIGWRSWRWRAAFRAGCARRGWPRRDLPAPGRAGRRAVDGPLQPASVRRLGRAGAVPGGVLRRRQAAGRPSRRARRAAALRDARRRSASAARRRLAAVPRRPGLTGAPRPRCPRSSRSLWTYEAGEAIESSAAIADGAVFVGRAGGRAARPRPRDGRAALALPGGGRSIGESSPAVAGGLVYVGDLKGMVHAVDAKDGRRPGRSRRASRGEGSPVVAEGKVLVGSYDQHLYALDAKTRPARLEARDRGPGARDRRRWPAAWPTSRAATSACGRSASPTARRCSQVSSGAYTGASPALARRPRLLRHVRERGAGRRPDGAEGRSGATSTRSGNSRSTPRPRWPTARWSSAGATSWSTRLDAATGKELWTFATQGARRLLPGDRGAAASTSGPTTAASTSSTWARRQAPGSSTRGRRSPRLPPSRAAGWSSAPRTAGSTAWGGKR